MPKTKTRNEVGPVRFRMGSFAEREWTGIISGFFDLSLMQTWEFAEAKAATGPWRVERCVFEAGDGSGKGAEIGAAQILIRRLPGGLPGGLAWINRGPLWRRSEAQSPDILVAMMAELAGYLAAKRGLYLRMAPPVTEGTLAPESLEDVGLKLTGTAGWASAVLDLSSPLEDLRAGLRQNWRNGLNKAGRLGLEVESGSDDRLFEAFLDAQTRFVEDRGFTTTVTVELLRALQERLSGERRLESFVARDGADVLGTALMARYGETCEYLAGNSSDAGRRGNVGQLLLWRVVEVMKERGLRYLDLGGMDPDLTPEGIYRFKDGLGGVPYRLCTEVEAEAGLLSRLVRWRVHRARPGS